MPVGTFAPKPLARVPILGTPPAPTGMPLAPGQGLIVPPAPAVPSPSPAVSTVEALAPKAASRTFTIPILGTPPFTPTSVVRPGPLAPIIPGPGAPPPPPVPPGAFNPTSVLVPPPTPPITPGAGVPMPNAPVPPVPAPPTVPAPIVESTPTGIRGLGSRLGASRGWAGAKNIGRSIGTGLGTNLAVYSIPRAFGVDINTADMTSTAPRRLTGAAVIGTTNGAYFGPAGALVGAAGATAGQGGFDAMQAAAQSAPGQSFLQGVYQPAENELAKARGSDNPIEKTLGYAGSAANFMTGGGWMNVLDQAGKNGPSSLQNVMGRLGGKPDADAPETAAEAVDPVRKGLEQATQQRDEFIANIPNDLAAVGRDYGVSDETMKVVTDEYQRNTKIRQAQFDRGLLMVPVEQRVAFDDEGTPRAIVGPDGSEMELDDAQRAQIIEAGVTADQTGFGTYTTQRKATADDLAAINLAEYQQIITQGLPEIAAVDAERQSQAQAAEEQRREQQNRMLGQSLALQSLMQPYVDQSNQIAGMAAGMGPWFAPMSAALQNQANSYGAWATAAPMLAYNEQAAAQAQAQAQMAAEQQQWMARQDYEQQQRMEYELWKQQNGIGGGAGGGSDQEAIAQELTGATPR